MEQQPRLPLWFLIVNCSLIAIAFVAGVMLGDRRIVELPQPQSDALQLVYREILKSHVEPQDGAELMDRAIAAMAGELDDYSRYVPPARVKVYEESTTGRYEGVGMVMRQHGEDIVVHFPFTGGPAERAGLRPGDRVLEIDGKAVAELPVADRSVQATELVRGPAETTVELVLDRDGERITATVERDAVQRPAVKWSHVADSQRGLGYVHVTDFHEGITRGVRTAITELQRESETGGGALRGLIIDLRWNGGGSLDECVALSRLFQPTGAIVSTRRRGQEIERVDAEASECLYPDLPLVLLMNSESASASEVFAGCLQDHGRATVVGTRTFGKGVVNTIYSWPDFKLKLTTAHYYTPKGRSLGGSHRQQATANGKPPSGITPDVESAVSEQQLPPIQIALFRHEVPARYRTAYATVAERYGFKVPRPPQPDTDSQLAAALAQLGDRIDGGK
ncbi:MAG: S41 family peptidase [bacterium]|nr:S41 family peptidase [bacterium]